MCLGLFIRKSAPLQPGIKYTSKKVLQYAVVLLGFGMNLTDIHITRYRLCYVQAFENACQNIHAGRCRLLICGGSAIVHPCMGHHHRVLIAHSRHRPHQGAFQLKLKCFSTNFNVVSMERLSSLFNQKY